MLLSIRRNTSLENVHETIRLINTYRKHGVRGFDISDMSTQGNGAAIFESITQIKESKIPITLHIGESSNETPKQQMKELYEIEPQRIGMVYFFAMKHSNGLRIIKHQLRYA